MTKQQAHIEIEELLRKQARVERRLNNAKTDEAHERYTAEYLSINDRINELSNMSGYETPTKSNNNNNNTNVIPEDDENTGQGLKRKKKMSDEGLSNFQINRIMKPYIQQGLYLGTVSRDEFDQVIEKIKPQSRGGFIFNTDPSTKPGQHWRAIFFDGRPKGDSEIDYYDSYGASASKGDLKNIKKIADKLQANTYLKYKENKVVQQNNESANCGFFTVKFIIDRINGKHFTACSGWDEHVKGEKNIEKFKEQMGYGAPWKYVPSFGSGLLDSAKNTGLKTFQSASNAYRRAYLRKHPDANVRMLDLGELHYGSCTIIQGLELRSRMVIVILNLTIILTMQVEPMT